MNNMELQGKVMPPKETSFLQNKLEENENYFISWLKDLPFEKNIDSFKGYLYISNEPYQYEDDIHENYYVWKIQTFDSILRPVIKAFLSVSFGKEDLAKKLISRVQKVVHHCVETNIFAEEYAKGIMYLCTLTTVHINCKFGNPDENDYTLLLSCSFDDLTSKGKTMVLFAKSKLKDIIRVEDPVIMRQIISLDPNNWLWSWLLYTELERIRKDEDVPSDEEIKAILDAVDLTECTKYHAKCISHFCQLLAEILNNRVQNNLPNATLDVGGKCFGSNEDVVEFIKANSSNAFKNHKTYMEAKTIKLYGVIFSSILPLEFQDSDLAMKYKKMYLKIIHENCDGVPPNESCLAEHNEIYLQLVQRISYCLKFHEKAAEVLDDIFVTIFENEHWNEQEAYSFHFLHGCYLSIKDDVQNAIVHWLQMDSTAAPTSFLFIDFAYIVRMRLHRRPENVGLNLDKVLTELLVRLNQDDLPDLEKEKFNILKNKLENVIKLEIQINQFHKNENKSDLTIEEVVQDVQAEIKECNTYFVHWLNGGAITNQQIYKIIEDFDFLVHRPYQELHPTEDSLKSRFSTHHEASAAPKTIITYLIEAFLHISFGILDLGGKNISLAQFAINHCVNNDIFCEEYAAGLQYICSMLTVHLHRKWDCTTQKFDLDIFLPSSFDLLPKKGRAIVYYAEFLFITLLPNRQNESSVILREIVNLDANNWSWPWEFFLHLNVLRYKNKISLPTEEEIEAISTAVELSVYDDEHLSCVRAMCTTLAEIIGHRIKKDLPNTQIKMGNTFFKSNDVAIAFIKRKASECITSEATRNPYIKVNILKKYASIFRHTLPFKIRDTEFAEMCEEACQKLIPEDEECDYEIFLEEQQKEYRPSIDLIQTLLQNPEKNSEKLNKIFVAIWEQENSWQEHETYSLHFLHGCYLLMVGDVNGALMQWLQMNFKTDNEMKFLFLDFAVLSRIKDYYHWSNELSFAKVHDEISLRFQKEITSSEKERLTLLKLKIENSENILRDEKCELEAQEDQFEPRKSSCQISERDKSELEKCETYFINWFGDCQMTKKKFESITESLYELLPQPDQQTEEEVKEDFSGFVMIIVQKIIAPLVEAFLHIKFGNLDLVVKIISWVDYVTKHCGEKDVLCEEYIEGIRHLCDLVKVHANLTLESSNNLDFSLDLDSNKHIFPFDFSNLRSFESLSAKGKSMFFVAKWILNEAIPHRKYNSIEDLKQIVSLDIDNWIWNYTLCSRLRFLRRQDGYSGPEEEEIYAIAKAVEKSVSMPRYHGMCLSGLCQCLAEIINHRFHERLPNTPVNIGTKIFQSEKEVVEYIKATANEAFNGDALSFGEAIRYGEMFSSLLSFKHRDYELAEKCYKLCLDIIPSNSKANHKMGILQLTGKGDMEQAIHYLKLAVEFTPKNFPAWIDLIQTLLAFPRENSSEIEKLFKSFWENSEEWNENEQFSAHFLEGCYLAKTGEIPRAVSLWTQHNSHIPPSEKSSDFHQLQRVSKRHKWPQRAGLDYEALIDEILIRMESISVPDKEKLKLLKVKIENEIYRQNCRFEYGSTAGSTYRGRSHHHWQSRTTVAEKVSSWRTSNLTETPNDSDDIVRQPEAPSTNRYVPPHLRARGNQNNKGQNTLPSRGSWR